MTIAKMTCRVCGKEYEPCRTAIKNPNVFHWQEVACSPKCGAEYLQRVKESRTNTALIKRKHKKLPEFISKSDSKVLDTAEVVAEPASDEV